VAVLGDKAGCTVLWLNVPALFYVRRFNGLVEGWRLDLAASSGASRHCWLDCNRRRRVNYLNDSHDYSLGLSQVPDVLDLEPEGRRDSFLTWSSKPDLREDPEGFTAKRERGRRREGKGRSNPMADVGTIEGRSLRLKRFQYI